MDLSKLILFLSEYLHIKGVISLTPISVAFSRNHSNLSLFLVNEIATLSFGESFLNSNDFSISKIDLFLSDSIIEQLYKNPLPSVIFTLSPVFFLRTLIKWLFS